MDWRKQTLGIFNTIPAPEYAAPLKAVRLSVRRAPDRPSASLRSAPGTKSGLFLTIDYWALTLLGPDCIFNYFQFRSDWSLSKHQKNLKILRFHKYFFNTFLTKNIII